MYASRLCPWLRLALSIVLALVVLVPTTVAQETSQPVAPDAANAPPQPGTAVLEDMLIGPNVVQTGTCLTGRNARQFIQDGYLLKVTGPCSSANPAASIGANVQGVTFPDGEVRVEMRAASGTDRAAFILPIRIQSPGNEYRAIVEPGRGAAQLIKLTNGQDTILAQRADLADVILPDDWNSVSLLAWGPRLWLLLNDQAVLSVADSTYTTGRLGLRLLRTGDSNDDQESAILLRNLRVSGLATGDQVQTPTYLVPETAAAATGRVLVRDDFSDRNSGFAPYWQHPSGTFIAGYSPESGLYFIENLKGGFYHFSRSGEYSDCDVQIRARLERSSTPDVIISLGIGTLGPGKEWRLGFRPNQSQAFLQKLGDEVPGQQIGSTLDVPGRDEILLRLIRKGSSLTALVADTNDGIWKVVARTNDETYRTGRVSVGIFTAPGQSAKAIFRELIIRTVD